MRLPLHIFEPRYRAMVSDALIRDRRIGMVQPRGEGERPDLFDIGCVGRIIDVQTLADGRFDIVLEGLARFTIVQELDVKSLYRQVDVRLDPSAGPETLSSAERAAVEIDARRFADALGYAVDWAAVERLDDETLVNGIAQIAPFDAASKQALLEADTLSDRADLVVQLMQFFGRSDERPATLQ